MSLLQVEGLVKSFGDRTVVKGVSYHVGEGEIVGLLGPNGAGKTTTFRMTVGMVRPDEGEVLLDDHDITHLPMYKRARLGMGYLSQEPSIFRHMTVRENLLAVLEARGVRRRDRLDRTDELIDDLGLAHVEESRSTTLSGGERRRLELARTLALEPRLILLDEPFSGVDPIAVEDIQHHLHALRDEGIAVLITDHAVRETLGTTDRAYIIYEGEIFRHGDAETLASDPKVREVYLGETFTMSTADRPLRVAPAAAEPEQDDEPDDDVEHDGEPEHEHEHEVEHDGSEPEPEPGYVTEPEPEHAPEPDEREELGIEDLEDADEGDPSPPPTVDEELPAVDALEPAPEPAPAPEPKPKPRAKRTTKATSKAASPAAKRATRKTPLKSSTKKTVKKATRKAVRKTTRKAAPKKPGSRRRKTED